MKYLVLSSLLLPLIASEIVGGSDMPVGPAPLANFPYTDVLIREDMSPDERLILRSKVEGVLSRSSPESAASVAALRLRATLDLIDGKPSDALLALNKCVLLDPSSEQFKIDRVRLMASTGHKDFHEEADLLGKQFPKSHAALALSAFSKVALGQLERGHALLLESIRLEPDNQMACNILAKIYYDNGNYIDALRASNQGIASTPYSPGQTHDAYLIRSNICIATGQFEKALPFALQARKIARDQFAAESEEKLWLCYCLLGQTSMARKCADKLVVMNPNLPSSHRALAHTLLDQGDYRAAEISLGRARELRREDSLTEVMYCRYYKIINKPSEEIQCAHNAVKYSPTNPVANLMLATVLLTSGDQSLRDFSRAKQISELHAKRTFRKDPNWLVLLAATHALNGESDNALSVLNEAEKLKDMPTSIYTQLALLKEQVRGHKSIEFVKCLNILPVK